MEVTVAYKHLSSVEEREFNDYITPKIQSFQPLLTKFSEDSKNLKIHVEKFEKHNAFKLEMRLLLHSKELIAEETSHSFTKAIDLAKDRLTTQLKRHIAHLQKNREHQSIRTI